MPSASTRFLTEMLDLTDAERALAASCINVKGEGGHPEARPDNLEFFSTTYLRDCVESALASGHLTVPARRLASNILNAIG